MNNERLRQHIMDLVSSVIPYDSIEQEHIKDIEEWIQSGTEIFRVEKHITPPKHLVSYAVLVDTYAGKILLLDHKKAQLMLPSGGHVEKGEVPHKAAERELQEELRIVPRHALSETLVPFFVTVTETVGTVVPQHTDVDLWYVFEGDSTAQVDNSSSDFAKEFDNHYWLDFDEVLAMPIEKFDIHMHRFVNKLKKQLSMN